MTLVALIAATHCAHAQPRIASVGPKPAGPPPQLAPVADKLAPASQPASQVAAPARPTAEHLRGAIQAVLDGPGLARARVSVLVDRALVPPAEPPTPAGPAPLPATVDNATTLPTGAQPHSPASRPTSSAAAAASQPASQPSASALASQPATPATTRPSHRAPVGPTPLASRSTAPAPALVAVAADTPRVPASNAKLLTTTAAYLTLPGRYRFVTEVGVRGRRIYLRGTGDPLLRRRDLARLARAVRARGVRAVAGITVDDHHFDRQQLAPGFSAFTAGSHYRPTSSALNVDSNALVIKISAPKNRRRPRVDVLPPSDYVKVRKLVRLVSQRKRGRRRKPRIKVSMRRRGAIMWLTVSGTFPRGARPISTRRAVYDPAFNVGWAFRRALVEAGVRVTGVVGRGRWPKGARRLAMRGRALSEVLRITNTHSDNLAAENLVRAMGMLASDPPAKGGTWPRGLVKLEQALEGVGLSGFTLGNGSGLHRRSRVSARTLVALIQRIFSDARLRRALLPTLAVAGRSGTLARRLRGSDAAGLVLAKTGTLGNALALSGLVDPSRAKEPPAPADSQPLAFSILVNGRADRAARASIDRIALLLARYARGLPLDDPPPTDEDDPAGPR